MVLLARWAGASKLRLGEAMFALQDTERNERRKVVREDR